MFFDRFREATARLPAGLIRPAPAATPDMIARAEARLGPLPAPYASFLRSFDGADLFHEAIVIAGVGASAPRALTELNDEASGADGARPLVFAEAVAGDRFALDARGRVLRLRAGSDERIVAGSTFERWLDATIARERVLYGADGEFAPDVFDDDGEEIAPVIVVRQTERALRIDPGSAEAQHERGVALRRLGRLDRAVEAFAAATELDPENPWPWFDLGRTALTSGVDLPRARAAFERAAALEEGPPAARLYAWAARAARAAGDDGAAEDARRAALARDPALLDAFTRAEAQAALEGDDDARAENEALRLALAPGSSARRSLPVLTAESSRRPRPSPPPRPAPAARPRGGASPRAGRPRR
ncbi:MAG TPA: tetratricopeptide repeat protein [Polyangia bacterium]|nr:tetratricopeptide repeat protein [Polyangia bacterium]